MTKGKKAALIILALMLALAATAAIAYSRLLYPTGEIMPGLYAIRSGGNGSPAGNFFLMQIGEKYIAIDAGGDAAQTEGELRKLGISADEVAAVFVTHADWDHIGSLDVFDGAIIYTGNTENSPFPDIPHQIMSDGETVALSGMSVQCIYAPGHTVDSVCYLIDGKYLFAGDAFFNPRYDRDLHAISREKVLGIEGVEYVFTGHFGLFKNVRFFRWFRLG